MAETKLLDFNLVKSCYMAIGTSRSLKDHYDHLHQNPITLCGKPMPCVSESKLLGDWLSQSGLSNSVATTVAKRKGLAIASIYEIRSVVEDCRSNILGGLQIGLNLWEATIVPMLLFNSETWVNITDKTLNELETIQKRFLRCILAVGPGCPIPSMYWETGTVLMKYRILQRKLIFLHHLSTLPDSSLAKEVYTLQKQLNLPGLLTECEEFLHKYELYDMESYSKAQWKRKVKAIIFQLNEDNVVSMSKNYKKINYTFDIDHGKRHLFLSQLKLHDARMMFKIRSNMVSHIQMNFKSDQRYTKNMWLCPGCNTNLDTQSHVMQCEGYSNLRSGLDVNKDVDLIKFFHSIISLRVIWENDLLPE